MNNLLDPSYIQEWERRQADGNLSTEIRKFYGHHHDFVNRYGTSVSHMTTDMFQLS